MDKYYEEIATNCPEKNKLHYSNRTCKVTCTFNDCEDCIAEHMRKIGVDHV